MKSLRIYLIVFTTLLVVYLIAQYNRPKEVNWNDSFDFNEKIPYGTYILNNRINDIFKGSKILTFREPPYNVINDNKIKNANYLIINSEVNINDADYGKLVTFIKNGNNVFISAATFGDELFKKLNISTIANLTIGKNDRYFHFTNKSLDTTHTYHLGNNIRDYFFLNFDTSKAFVLGLTQDKKVNFLKYQMGKGNLYLSSNPYIYTNVALMDSAERAYAETSLSFIKNKPNLVLDQYYALGREADSSSMRVFLLNSTLRWAFYISLFSLLFFVIYEIKRRQRIIPVIEPLENATLSFINVVGQVYFEQHDNLNICQKKISYLLEHIRTLYNIKTNVLDEEFIKSLAHKTGINDEFVNALIKYIIGLETNKQVTNAELIKLNKLIEEFYLKASK